MRSLYAALYMWFRKHPYLVGYDGYDFYYPDMYRNPMSKEGHAAAASVYHKWDELTGWVNENRRERFLLLKWQRYPELFTFPY